MNGQPALSAPLEYLPLIVYALVFFIGPTIISGIGFWWLWRHRRARVRSRRLRLSDSMRGARHQSRAEHAHDKHLRAS